VGVKLSVLRFLIVALAAVFASLNVGISPASAHAGLAGSSPAANATVAELPDSIELTFSAAIELGLAEVKVTDAEGKRIDKGKPTQGSIAGKSAKVAVQGSKSGLHKVDWKVGSGDGHSISGTFSFTVTSASISASKGGSSATELADVTTTTAASVDQGLRAQPIAVSATTSSEASSLPTGPIALGLLSIALVLLFIRQRV
jgi:methionine-rich copper-binding protein CopC